MATPVLLVTTLVTAPGCQDAEGSAEVAVKWGFERGSCVDIDADSFRLRIEPEGTSMEVPCVDREVPLELPLGAEVALTAEMTSAGEPITAPKQSGEFGVPPGGVDVDFYFELADFFYTSDFRFTLDYTGALVCDDTAITVQRITLYDADGNLVEGARVCDTEGNCVDADGSPGPCYMDEQVIAELPWGRYTIDFVGEAPASCYRRVGVPIQIDFSTQIREFRVNRTEEPCS